MHREAASFFSPRYRATRALVGVVLIAGLWALPGEAGANPSFPSPPGRDQTFLDEGEFFPADARSRAAAAAKQIAAEHACRLHVVVIPSLKDVGASGWTVPEFARELLERWTSPALPSSVGAQSTSSAARPDSLSPERSVVVVLSAGERTLAVRPGKAFLGRADEIRTIEQVFAHFLDRGERGLAATEGVAAIGQMAADRSVTLPGSLTLSYVLIVAFVLVGLTVVDYLRKGPTCWSYRCWRALFSGVTVAMTWALTRSVDIGARLANGVSSDEEPDPSVVLGEW